jgi:hypothetical protein
MEWNEIIKILGITTGPQIILVIILGFTGKRLIEYFFAETVEIKKKELEQDLENHKQNLEQENRNLQLGLDKNLETYKNKLEILRLEFKVQFAELHAKRSEIISVLYKLLSELNRAMLNLTARGHMVHGDADKEEQERFENANNAISEFSKFYSPHKIYFTNETAVKLDKIQEFLWGKAWDFSFIKSRIKDGNLQATDWKQYSKELREISESVSEESKSTMIDLENEFRDLLGVNSRSIIDQLKEKEEK